MSNYLCHHGVKGQKWGIRRYQNPDGTLTSEGKKHYGNKLDSARKTRWRTAAASIAGTTAGIMASTLGAPVVIPTVAFSTAMASGLTNIGASYVEMYAKSKIAKSVRKESGMKTKRWTET